MITKAFADFFMSYQDGIDISNSRAKGDNLCKIGGYIQGLNIEGLESNASAISDFKFVIYSFGDTKRFEITSMGVMNNLTGNDIQNAGLLQKIDGKNYNPQLGDYIVAKINSENNYINELFVMNGKTGNEINKFLGTLKEPFCTGSIIKPESVQKSTQEPPKIEIINNPQNYYLFGIIIFLILIIGILLYKIYSRKN